MENLVDLLIYTLSDTTGNVFYVGCTTQNIETRLSGHISEAKKGFYRFGPKGKMIRGLNFNVVATVVHIEKINKVSPVKVREDAKLIEAGWIAKYISLGFELVNKEGRVKAATERENYIGKTVIVDNGKIIQEKP